MELEELDVRRLIFESEVRLILIQYQSESHKKVDYEEFRDIDKEYGKIKNHIKDEQLHNQYIAIRNKVNDIVREINKIDNKEDLKKIEEKVE